MGKTLRQTVAKERAAAQAGPDAPAAAALEPDTGVWAAVAAAVAGTERAAAEAVERVAIALRAAAGTTSAVEAAVDAGIGVGSGPPGQPLRTEWSAMLADPVLPWFSPDMHDAPAAVTFAAPAEQGLWRDISLASRVAAAVRASEARFAAAFDSAPTPLLIAATDAGRPARVLAANLAMGRLLGHSPASLLDLSVPELSVPELSVQELVTANGGSVDGPGDEPAAVRCEWRHAAGHLVPVRVRMAPGNGTTEVVLHVEQVPGVPALREG